MYVSGIDGQAIYDYLTNASGGIIDNKTTDICERILFGDIEDGGQSGDVIIVFGSPDCLEHRSPKAFETYFFNRANKIIVSGANTVPATGKSEAQSMWEQLRKYGVLNSDIFLEASAEYTHENVIFSADIIRSVFEQRPVKILAVTAAFHTRRVMLNFEHYRDMFASGTQFFAVPSADAYCESFLWQTTPTGRFKAATEIRSIINYIKKGYLPDFEI